jgi:hypothetical protein
MDLSAFVCKFLREQDANVLREGIRVMSQALTEARSPASSVLKRREPTGERTAYSNASLTWTWDTRIGTIEQEPPNVRSNAYFSSLLQLRRGTCRWPSVQEAYVPPRPPSAVAPGPTRDRLRKDGRHGGRNLDEDAVDAYLA